MIFNFFRFDNMVEVFSTIFFKFYNYIKNSINITKYNIRKHLSRITFLYDRRFLNNLNNYNFPFEKCSSITCCDINDNNVDINNYIHNNIKNLAIEKIYKKPVDISSIKLFCNIPKNVHTINCDIYPWENLPSFKINILNALKIS